MTAAEGFTDAHVLGSYYSALKPHGGLPHAEGLTNVAKNIHAKIGGNIDAIHKKVRGIFAETVGPEYVKPAAIDLMGRTLLQGADIFVWTVGDHGEGSDYYQQAKIEASRIEESLGNFVEKNGEPGTLVADRLHIHISSTNKHEELARILRTISEQETGIVYLADDKEENVAMARTVALGFPDIAFHEWIVKNDTDQRGNLHAFGEHVTQEGERLKREGKQFALVLDWDDTLTDEQERMHHVREKINREFTSL